MRSLPAILMAVLALCGAVFAGAYFVAQRVCVAGMSNPADDLDWLRIEFKLSPAEMMRIRALHEGYLPRCADYCRRIAVKKVEVEEALTGETNLTANARQHLLEQRLLELGELRARCQAQMFQHFEDVSQAMPPEQGKRYLAEMRELILGRHEQIEQSMDSSGHGHH